MKLTFTDKQYADLAPYAENFETAVNHDYSRPLPRGGARFINDIWTEATGSTRRVDYTCPDCVLRLLKAVGRAWLEDREERSRRRVGTAEAATEAVRKQVKTSKQ